MQSPRGQRLLEDCGLNPQVIDTFVLIEGQSHFTKSDAILKVATYLSGIWPLFRIFSLIPRPIRNWAYHIIAKSRYDVFGKRQTCMIPSKELLVRFLE
jgi:predicted DCC family thiol-disulfide oxidoreductase YuxK